MEKKKIGIVVDSSAGFSEKESKKLGMAGFIPINITIDGKTFKDGIDTDSKSFEKSMNTEMDIQTSAPSPETFNNVFAEALKKYDEIIYVALSHKVSATQQSSRIALENNDKLKGKVHIPESLFFGAWITFVSQEMLKMANSGKSIDQILKYVEEAHKTATGVLYAETLTYLKNGGRVTSTKALIGNAFKLMPILTWNTKGLIDPKESLKGRMLDSTQDKTITEFKKHYDKVDKDKHRLVVLLPISSTKEYQDKFVDKVSKILEVEKSKISISFAGAVIIAHLGPRYGGIGMLLNR